MGTSRAKRTIVIFGLADGVRWLLQGQSQQPQFDRVYLYVTINVATASYTFLTSVNPKRSMVKSVLTYRAETCNLYEDDRRRINATEMDTLRRSARISK